MLHFLKTVLMKSIMMVSLQIYLKMSSTFTF